ncbi:hypothetical protein [Prosthecodimorpha staleyi]|uniref:Uncharacterized protein n=1 Tax=Prosthecodimorpha staleyi TaxID=2840188 RepID=A0A947D4K8_9HYPH|nr:hypothetical protein [Prosthecodimorpha staleyi]MBT9289466.1 hypothetical protein [Prosthecodimorpha staleyi]
MKVLIGTNHLADIAGSEMVAFEFTRHFRRSGADVTVFANHADDPMAGLFRAQLGLAIETRPERTDPLAFDLVYFQHQVAGLFDYRIGSETTARTAILFGRLSRHSFMESGGWAFDAALGDLSLANSDLTAERLRETGVRHPIAVFYNAAPAAFAAPPRPRPDRPRRILCVSNHRDPDLLAMLARLGRVSDLTHLGRFGDMVRMVEPADIHGADLVVSIGKTIPYGLIAHTPVYVYDHFGGPGYLTPENRDRAARYNFSGRCTERRLTPDAVVEEIMSRYADGVRFAATTDEDFLDRYRLEPHLDRWMQLAGTSNADRVARLAADHGRLEIERQLAAHVRKSYRQLKRAEASAKTR